VFWLQTGEIIQQCKAHKTTVTFLEFDATKIVSSGMDCCVKVIDIVSCEILHTIRGFDGPVLALRFDSNRITTLSKEGVKHWMWDSESKQSSSEKEGAFLFHTVAKGETMDLLCKIYDTSTFQLIKWNNGKRIECGQKIIVGRQNAIVSAQDEGMKKNLLNAHNASRPNRGYDRGGMQQYAWSAQDHTVLDTNTSKTNDMPPELVPNIKCEPASLAARFVQWS